MKGEYLQYALGNLMHRKLRTALNVLSIFIGIAAIFAIASFGEGMKAYIDDVASEQGIDKIFAQAKGFGSILDENFFFTPEELSIMRKTNGIDEATGWMLGGLAVKKDKVTKYVFGMSVPVDSATEIKLFKELMTVDILNGRMLKKGDKLKVLLGYNYQWEKKIFDRIIEIGEKIEINGVKVEVIGFFDQIGGPDDTNIYMTEDGFLQIFPEKRDKFTYLIGRSASDTVPADAAERVQDKIRKHRGQKEGNEDFYIQTFEQAIEAFTSVLNVVNGVILLIALISTFVAAINTMNTMYTAVLERTKEIGVMKAIGATNTDISIIFILESGIMGLLGALLGMSLGWLISTGGGIAAANAGFPMLAPIFPSWLIIGCTLFGLFIGVISGVLPAKQAAKLKPVDALRYE